MVKNVFIILTQVYKVYTVSREKRTLRYLENYRGLIMGAQQQKNQPVYGLGENHYFDTHQPINFNQHRNNNFLNGPHNAAIAAAATGGQIPLVNQQQYETYAKNYGQQQTWVIQQIVFLLNDILELELEFISFAI